MKKITIKELTNLYAEKFYGVELLSNKNYKTLKPFKWIENTNKLNVLAFKIFWNEKENINIIQILVNETKYNKLLNNLKEMNLYK